MNSSSFQIEDSLRCTYCKQYARLAVESNCDCQLIYCEQCSFQVSECQVCNAHFRDPSQANNLLQRDPLGNSASDSLYLSLESQNLNLFEAHHRHFTPSKLARRLLSQMTITCKEEGCGASVGADLVEEHRRKCRFRNYNCVHCFSYHNQRAPQEGVPQDGQFRGQEAFLAHVAEVHREQILREYDTLYGGGVPSGRSSFAKFMIMPQDLQQQQEGSEREGLHEHHFREEEKHSPPSSHADEQQNGSMSDELSQNANHSSVINQSYSHLDHSLVNDEQSTWRCATCKTRNSFEQLKCQKCNGEFLKNFQEMKGDMRKFIKTMRKEYSQIDIIQGEGDEQQKRKKRNNDCSIF
ncbi:hypothetical protein FGO68_gene13317 [Halteria grandinella]|uniref:RanBP2-type domain-containing protein n=1 Tax=Halteria grandinella TaxID=5974 RepID=A0A8J8T1A3_HALGN|nr:hypothetical protein FGO68_gene13317 [Halteria grandinella]